MHASTLQEKRPGEALLLGAAEGKKHLENEELPGLLVSFKGLSSQEAE